MQISRGAQMHTNSGAQTHINSKKCWLSNVDSTTQQGLENTTKESKLYMKGLGKLLTSPHTLVDL